MAAINLNASAVSQLVPSNSTKLSSLSPDDQLYTCLSCNVAFLSPDEQRDHMRSDWHRYNMKRRVATLPPVTAALFNRKVIERRNENAVTATKKGETCHLCVKSFASQGAYHTHVESKKHRDREVQEATRLLRESMLAAQAPKDESALPEHIPSKPVYDEVPSSTAAHSHSQSYQNHPHPDAAPSLNVDPDATEEELADSIDRKIAYARLRLTPTSCLFCNVTPFENQDETAKHMQKEHGFFIPDREYLVDLPGLLLYLGEKVSIGNVCLSCNGKGKEYRTLEAVRKHMIDKSHCKLAYSSESEKLEVSDYYDFSTSYADGAPPRRRKRRVAKEQLGSVEEGAEEWEDEEMAEDEQIGSDVEVVEEEDEDEYGSDYTDESLDDDDYPDRPTFDPETFELVLPSGRRIGHRSLMPYYKQRPSQPRETSLDLVPVEKRTIAGRTDQALIPARGGFGDFGAGQEVIKARNKGEAKNAMKHPYREMQKRERFKTQVGYIANSQKHWRDHLLQ